MTSNLSNIAIDLPKLLIRQAIQPLRLALRKSTTLPDTQQELAELVNHSLKHQIRAGFTHRFIDILFYLSRWIIVCFAAAILTANHLGIVHFS